MELCVRDISCLEGQAPPRAAAAIESQLQSAAPWRFPQHLENVYQALTGSNRRMRCAKVLAVSGVLSLAAAILDMFAGMPLFIAGLPWRLGECLLCLVCAQILRASNRPVPGPMAETALVCLPVLGNVVLVAVLGEFGGIHADRYMMSAAFSTSIAVCLLPLQVFTMRVCCGLCSLAYLLVPALLPRDVPLTANLDLVVFAWGMFGMASWIVRNTERRSRIGFLYQRRHALSAAELGVLNAELWRLSTTDALTGLNNRRAFSHALGILWRDSEQALGMLLIDVDWFKLFNDTAGHVAGDAALQAIGEAIRASLRGGTKMAARYGGEEFVILLPGATMADAASVAERVRQSVANLALPHPGRPMILQAGRALGVPSGHRDCFVSISVGVACYDAPSRGTALAEDMIRAADAALYAAKQRGRNCVVLAGTQPDIGATKPRAAEALEHRIETMRIQAAVSTNPS